MSGRRSIVLMARKVWRLTLSCESRSPEKGVQARFELSLRALKMRACCDFVRQCAWPRMGDVTVPAARLLAVLPVSCCPDLLRP